MEAAKTPQHLRLMLPVAVLVVLLILLAIWLGGRGRTEASDQGSIAQGLDYLKALEAKSPSEVEERLKEIHRQELQAMHDERLRQLESGEISVWSLFEDYVVFGDSRSCGFFFGNFLPRDRVLADYGNTIKAVDNYLDDMKQINPSYIFLCVGLNDIVQTGWETPELYAEGYKEYILKIREILPDAKIYVNSIFPCFDPAFKRWEKWREAPEYSAALGEMALSMGCYFIDNTDIIDQKYYQDDGIHFLAPFYPLWATNMIMEVYDSELEQDETPAA